MFNAGEFLLWVEKPPAAVVSPAVLGQETSSLRNWAIRRSKRLGKPFGGDGAFFKVYKGR